MNIVSDGILDIHFIIIYNKINSHRLFTEICNKTNIKTPGAILAQWYFALTWKFWTRIMVEILLFSFHESLLKLTKNDKIFVKQDGMSRQSTRNPEKNLESRLSPLACLRSSLCLDFSDDIK